MNSTMTKEAPYAQAVRGFVQAINTEKDKMQAKVINDAQPGRVISVTEVFRKGAEVVGGTASNFRGYYYGHSVPTLMKALRIAKWLGHPVEELFEDNTED